jgi:undecaprenyl-diphosphatase
LTILDAVLLAILQGFTEFLPVSSSGHLVLAQALLHVKDPQVLTFDVFVHFGTLISIALVFWKDILEILGAMWHAVVSLRFRESYRTSEPVRIGIGILVASIPAGVIGILFHHQVEEAFNDPKLVAVNLVITGLILFLTRLATVQSDKRVGVLNAFLIGIAQAVAILPGISRSGSTISSGMYLRLSPVRAARFSFLMAIPVIGGAALLESKNLLHAGTAIPLMPTIVGTVVAAVVGYVAIRLLLRIVQRGAFSWFSLYCLVVGILAILFI